MMWRRLLLALHGADEVPSQSMPNSDLCLSCSRKRWLNSTTI